MAHPPSTEASAGASARVGVELRRRREALGLDLDDVAGALRIPPRHLESIETSRHRALPARIYAIGFVRAYATYLGLDPRHAVDRFKIEARELDARPVLVFPEPAAERRVPGGALVAVSVCAALTVYAVWYMQTAQHWAHGDRVPDAPVQIALDDTRPASERGVVDLAPALGARNEFVPPSETPAERPLQTVASASGPAGTAQGTWRPVPIDPSPLPAVAAPPAPAPTSGPPLPRARPDPNAPPTVVADSLRRNPPGTGPAPAAEYASVPAVTIEPRTTQLAQAPSTAIRSPAANLPATGSPAASVAAAGGVIRVGRPGDGASWTPVMRGAAPAQAAESAGSGAGAAWAQMPSSAVGPVVLRAAEASWIEVRSESGEVVHARLMKAGESYEVPTRPGLRLTTGNAGGLDVTVGGEATPKLGARGAVMREIPLEGPRLLSGTAVRN